MVRWLPKSIPFLATTIAVYFACYYGIESLRVLTSPVYGLDDAFFAKAVYGVGRFFNLEPSGLIWIAVLFGGVKLSIAALFAVYMASRIKAWFGNSLLGHEADHEIVDASVLLVASVTIVAALPALLYGDNDLLAQSRLPLWLGGLAVTLTMIERVVADETDRARRAHRPYTVYDVVLPPKRCGANTLRWDALRRAANVNAA